jgi:hypothetical protein
MAPGNQRAGEAGARESYRRPANLRVNGTALAPPRAPQPGGGVSLAATASWRTSLLQ